MVDICHYTFVQIHRMYNIKTSVAYGLWISMMYKCRLILSKKKSTILVSDVYNGEGYVFVRDGDILKSLYFPFNFIINLKLF